MKAPNMIALKEEFSAFRNRRNNRKSAAEVRKERNVLINIFWAHLKEMNI